MYLEGEKSKLGKEKLEEINLKLKGYHKYLTGKNPSFLENIRYHAMLNSIFKEYYEKYSLIDYQETYKNLENKLTKELMTNSFDLAKQYFHDVYNGMYDVEIEEIVKNGTINLLYRDEDDEKEDRYNQNYDDNVFSCGWYKHPYVNLPCYGTIIDGQIIVHEIRHYLNMPQDDFRSYTNDTITEGISTFEELNYLDYVEKTYLIEEVNLLRKYLFYLRYVNCDNFNFVSLLVSMYDELGEISIENYKIFIEEESAKCFEDDLLNKKFKLNLHYIHWYIFGTIIASYMHQKVKEDSTFISKINDFNTMLKNNPSLDKFLNVFHSINLDINNHELLEEYLTKEFEWLKNLSDKPELTR